MEGIPPHQQHLIHAGRELEDQCTIANLRLLFDSLYLVDESESLEEENNEMNSESGGEESESLETNEKDSGSKEEAPESFDDETNENENENEQNLPNSEAEIWKLLKDFKIEASLLNRLYLHLVDNPHRVRALVGCPKDNQKGLLLEMVSGFVAPPRQG